MFEGRTSRFQLIKSLNHWFRSDFRLSCPKTVKECLPPLSVYVRQVNSVKDELLRTQGLEVEHVLVTSDETDRKFWADVTKQGWHRIDHVAERSAELYGSWYVPNYAQALRISEATRALGSSQSST